MKVLSFATCLPHPGITHAGGVFLLRHLEVIARHHDLTLVLPASPAVRRDLHKAPPWLQIVLTPYQAPSRMRRQIDRVPAALRFRPVDGATRRGLREGGFYQLAVDADVVELQWQESAVLTKELRRAGVSTPVAVVAHDVVSEATLSRARSFPVSRLQRIKDTLRPIHLRTERADFNRADLVLVFKREDEALLRRLGVVTQALVLQPPLDWPSSPAQERPEPVLLFTGLMGRRENSESIGWFLRSVWRSVRGRVPEATLTVVGADPPSWLRQMADESPGVTVTGEVPSLTPFYEKATAFVAPLLVSGGLHFKVVQAMAYGLPVVASTTAAAGIVEVAPPGTFWAVTDDPSHMSDAIVQMLLRPQEAAVLGQAAASWCKQHFDFETSTLRVLKRYEELAEG
jgi:glycosyltransferase involved in cell wall biosynthesis